MRVRDVMSRKPICCSPKCSLVEVAHMMLEKDFGEIPVVVDKVPVGRIADRDIVCRVVANAGNPLDLTVGEIMTKTVVSIGPDSSLEECRERMEEHQLYRLPVVDSRGEICGIIAQSDLAKSAAEEQTAEILPFVSGTLIRAAKG